MMSDKVCVSVELLIELVECRERLRAIRDYLEHEESTLLTEVQVIGGFGAKEFEEDADV